MAADHDRNPLVFVFGRYGESHRPHLVGGLLARGLSANLWRVQTGDVQELPESFLEDVERRLGEASGGD